jgi:hypothetical protein
MSYSLIITAHLVGFTSNFKSWVRKNINPSMVNVDGIEASYFLQDILDAAPALSQEDKLLIVELQSKDVEYVEF